MTRGPAAPAAVDADAAEVEPIGTIALVAGGAGSGGSGDPTVELFFSFITVSISRLPRMYAIISGVSSFPPRRL